MPSVIAVDIGGTKLTTAVVDQDGNVSGRNRCPVARNGLNDSVKRIQRVIRESVDASQATDIQAVGLVVPGFTPVTFFSQNVPVVEKDHNQKVFQTYSRALFSRGGE